MRFGAQSIDDILKQLDPLEDISPDNVFPIYDATKAPDIEDLKKKLESPKTQKLLKDEMARLGKSTQEVDTAFRNVSRGLAKIAAMATHAEQFEYAATLGTYKTRWDSLHETYVELVWKSRRVAGNAQAVAVDFAEGFLDVIKKESYSIEVKKREIAMFRKISTNEEENARDLSQSFIQLHDNVAAFRDGIRDDKTWAEDINERVEKLLDDIKKLEEGLKRTKKFIGVVGAGGLALGAVPRVMAALGIVCPPLGIASLVLLCIGGAALLGGGIHYHRLDKKRNKLKKQLHKHAKSPKTVSDILAGVGGLESDMSFILQKLVIFSSIWAIIRADLQGIENDLKLASGTTIGERFEKKIEAIAEGYKTMALALRLYEANVDIKHPE